MTVADDMDPTALEKQGRRQKRGDEIIPDSSRCHRIRFGYCPGPCPYTVIIQ